MKLINQNISENLELPPISYAHCVKSMGIQQHTQLSKMYGTEELFSSIWQILFIKKIIYILFIFSQTWFYIMKGKENDHIFILREADSLNRRPNFIHWTIGLFYQLSYWWYIEES